MSDMPWVRFFPSDWLGGTRALSAAETGIYITLIATMYERSSPIAFDHVKLARLCGASNSTFKAALASLIDDGKIIETEDGLWNERVAKEVVYRQEKSEVGSRAAKAKWDKKRNENNDHNDAPAMPSQSDRNANQKPEPDISSLRSDITPSAKSSPAKNDLAGFIEVLSELGSDRLDALVKVRRAKRAPINAYSATLFSKAAEKCRITVTEAADMCIERNWLTVKPEWIAAPTSRGSPSSQKPRTIAEASARLVAQMRESENANTQSRPTGELFEQDVRYLAAPER